MAKDGDCAWNLGKAFDVRNVCSDEPLGIVRLLLQSSPANDGIYLVDHIPHQCSKNAERIGLWNDIEISRQVGVYFDSVCHCDALQWRTMSSRACSCLEVKDLDLDLRLTVYMSTHRWIILKYRSSKGLSPRNAIRLL